MIQREIARAQDEAIRMYMDLLVSGSGVMGEGNVEDLIALTRAALKKTKTQLETVMTRHLAIADPRNGPKFIKEVRKFCNVKSLILKIGFEGGGQAVSNDEMNRLSYAKDWMYKSKEIRKQFFSSEIAKKLRIL